MTNINALNKTSLLLGADSQLPKNKQVVEENNKLDAHTSEIYQEFVKIGDDSAFKQASQFSRESQFADYQAFKVQQSLQAYQSLQKSEQREALRDLMGVDLYA